MQKQKIAKLAAILLIIVITINLILFVIGKISGMLFWALIIIAALFAYKVLPKLNKN